MNKDFQETASLSIVLTLFIHEISSKHDRDHNIQAEYLTDVTKMGNGERGAGSGERGAGERGTKVWERVVSGNLHKNPKWPVRIKNPVRSMIEKRRNNT